MILSRDTTMSCTCWKVSPWKQKAELDDGNTGERWREKYRQGTIILLIHTKTRTAAEQNLVLLNQLPLRHNIRSISETFGLFLLPFFPLMNSPHSKNNQVCTHNKKIHSGSEWMIGRSNETTKRIKLQVGSLFRKRPHQDIQLIILSVDIWTSKARGCGFLCRPAFLFLSFPFLWSHFSVSFLLLHLPRGKQGGEDVSNSLCLNLSQGKLLSPS